MLLQVVLHSNIFYLIIEACVFTEPKRCTRPIFCAKLCNTKLNGLQLPVQIERKKFRWLQSTGIYQVYIMKKKDIYRDIISTIEKRNLSGYDIFLQTHFWILFPIIYPIFILDIISLDICPSQVCLQEMFYWWRYRYGMRNTS